MLHACHHATIVRFARTAEPIEMRFALWTRVSQTNRVLDGGPHPPSTEGNLMKEGGATHCNV